MKRYCINCDDYTIVIKKYVRKLDGKKCQVKICLRPGCISHKRA
jgi:hypothetical protein